MATISNEKKPIISGYMEAFCKYANCSRADVQTRQLGTHLVVLHNHTTYLVSRFDDFKNEFSDYFTRESFEEVATQISPAVWEMMLEEGEIEADELIVAIYRNWHKYWHKVSEGKDIRHIKKLQEKDYQDLMVLFETISINPNKAVNHANNLGMDFVPIIAFAIMEQYASFDDFLSEAVDFYVSYGKDLITMGHTWEVVIVNENSDSEDPGDIFYIYNPMWKFEDMEEV